MKMPERMSSGTWQILNEGFLSATPLPIRDPLHSGSSSPVQLSDVCFHLGELIVDPKVAAVSRATGDFTRDA
jgi:hypothetical protein